MNKKLTIFAAASLLLALGSCKDDAPIPAGGKEPEVEKPRDTAVEYSIRQVLQCDPETPEGVNIAPALDFFGDVRLTLWLHGTEVTHFEYRPGDVPFSPFDYTVPTGKVECVMDRTVEPHEIRVKSTGELFAVMEAGELVVNFSLDNPAVVYKYKFGE